MTTNGLQHRVVDLVKYITARAFNSSRFQNGDPQGSPFLFFHGLAARPDTFSNWLAFGKKLALRFDALVKNFTKYFMAHVKLHIPGLRSRTDLQGFLLADDCPSRPGFQRPLRENAPHLQTLLFHQATGVSSHLVRGVSWKVPSAIWSKRRC